MTKSTTINTPGRAETAGSVATQQMDQKRTGKRSNAASQQTMAGALDPVAKAEKAKVRLCGPCG